METAQHFLYWIYDRFPATNQSNQFFLPLLSSLLKDGADQSVALEAGILASSGNRLGGYGEDGGLSASSPPGSAPGSASRSGIHHASLRFREVTDDLIKS